MGFVLSIKLEVRTRNKFSYLYVGFRHRLSDIEKESVNHACRQSAGAPGSPILPPVPLENSLYEVEELRRGHKTKWYGIGPYTYTGITLEGEGARTGDPTVPLSSAVSVS